MKQARSSDRPDFFPIPQKAISYQLKGPNDFPVEIRAHELDNSLDPELKWLQMLTSDAGKAS